MNKQDAFQDIGSKLFPINRYPDQRSFQQARNDKRNILDISDVTKTLGKTDILPDQFPRLLTAPMNDHATSHGVSVCPDHLCEVASAGGDDVHIGHRVVTDLPEPGLYGEPPVGSLVQLSYITEQVLTFEYINQIK